MVLQTSCLVCTHQYDCFHACLIFKTLQKNMFLFSRVKPEAGLSLSDAFDHFWWNDPRLYLYSWHRRNSSTVSFCHSCEAALFSSSSRMHLTPLQMRLREPKHKLQQLRLFFSRRCWSAPAMTTAPVWLLISFCTFAPHQYSNVVGCSLPRQRKLYFLLLCQSQMGDGHQHRPFVLFLFIKNPVFKHVFPFLSFN